MGYEFRPAKRENVPLLLGLAGGTGSGKTYSAMRLASGLVGPEGRFAVIDTENGRARHYADEFGFDVADLRAPYRPAAYEEAIRAADAAGYPVIVVDSMTHEWDGEGGLLDWHEEEYQRMGGRDNVKLTAWITPKMAHRKFVSNLLQIKAHLILCFRAAERVEMVRNEKGRMEVIPKQTRTGLDGWVPITEPKLPFELTMSLLLTHDAPGVPKPVKLQEQHRALIPLTEPITEGTGAALGAWARGIKVDTEASVEELSERLLALADQLGSREIVEEAIEKSKAQRGEATAAQVKWLRAQIANAEAKAIVAAPEQSELSEAQEAIA